jgi:hypothetical protein
MSILDQIYQPQTRYINIGPDIPILKETYPGNNAKLESQLVDTPKKTEHNKSMQLIQLASTTKEGRSASENTISSHFIIRAPFSQRTLYISQILTMGPNRTTTP